MNIKIKFFIYGITGLAIEVFWTSLYSISQHDLNLSGYTYLWMFPIYGCGVFLEQLHNYIRNIPWVIRGLIWAAIIFFIEYTAGWTLRILLGTCPWDYTGQTKYAIDGLIRLDYTPVWFILGLLFEQFHDLLERYLNIPDDQFRPKI